MSYGHVGKRGHVVRTCGFGYEVYVGPPSILYVYPTDIGPPEEPTNTTTIHLPDHGCHVGDIAWLHPTRHVQIPRGMYRVASATPDSFDVKRSWWCDLMNRIFYA
jgi:hypothetical protein